MGPRLRRFEADRRSPHRHDVTRTQAVFTDWQAVDPCAIGRSEVDEVECVTGSTDLGVMSGDVRVIEHHVALREPTDRDGVVLDRDALTIGEHDGSDDPALSLVKLRDDAELGSGERLAPSDLDLNWTEEGVS